jgi:1-acyl-sn-glycerol-3-phosphate acyltransferase
MQPSLDQLMLVARFASVIGAAAPSVLFGPLPLTMLLTRRYRREEFLKRFHFMPAWAAFVRRHLLGIELEVKGREHLPKGSSRGAMIVSNHQSYVDIPVLMEALDTVAFLSKDLVAYIPLIGLCAYAGGTVFLKRRDKHSRQRALVETLRMCRESTAVVVFPEGTRSPDGSLKPEVRTASLEAAYREGLRVIPVGLDGTFDVVPKSMDRVVTGRRVAVEIGPALHPADFPDARSFSSGVWSAVTRLHERCRARTG